MRADQVCLLELVAWGLDESRYRPQTDEVRERVVCARNARNARADVALKSPLVQAEPSAMEVLDPQLQRADLHAEMTGLDWHVGIVDIEQLIAFQRRLVLDATLPSAAIPDAEDWPALIELCFAPAVPVIYQTVAAEGTQLVLQSENPNLQLRPSRQGLTLHGGSPFFEVAEYRGRWFLRDGYHRAYRLLRAGITHVPAVIVHARTLAEPGAVGPWFFAEETLFASRPPLVTDFLEDDLTLEYTRPRLFKTIRITVEESVEPALFPANPGEQP